MNLAFAVYVKLFSNERVLTLLVLLLKCLQSLHWSALGPLQPFWHSMLQAGTGSLLESLEAAGSSVPYITKYQFLRTPLLLEEP